MGTQQQKSGTHLCYHKSDKELNLGEQANTQQKDEEITFQVTKVVTYKYDYPMTENELWDARQDALNEPNRFMTMWCNENDAKQTKEEILSIDVVEGDGENDWFE